MGRQRLPEHIHIVGIGGIGLSAIARILAAWGRRVTGSDLRLSPLTEELGAEGIRVYEGHRAENVTGADLVVVSSAVPEGNPEVQAARVAGIPVVKRHDLLGTMMESYLGVAVAGTHGKTTTTAMIATVLLEAGEDPTVIVGGVMQALHTNAWAGRGRHFVVEADEYDRTFLGLRPDVAVITNVEMDHPDCYADLAAVREAFTAFVAVVPPEGHVVACADSPELMGLLRAARPAAGPQVVTYGLSAGADYVAADLSPSLAGGASFRVLRQGQADERVTLRVPGTHNVSNALATVVVGDLLGLDRAAVYAGLEAFAGVARRFEVKGEVAGITVVDDYAHHPTEVRATLSAARQRYGERRIWAVFQPHTYSRTAALLPELATCFGDADRVIITDIYAARARECATIRPEAVVEALSHPCVRYLAGSDALVDLLVQELRPGDVLLTLGAGDGHVLGERVLNRLARTGET